MLDVAPCRFTEAVPVRESEDSKISPLLADVRDTQCAGIPSAHSSKPGFCNNSTKGSSSASSTQNNRKSSAWNQPASLSPFPVERMPIRTSVSSLSTTKSAVVNSSQFSISNPTDCADMAGES